MEGGRGKKKVLVAVAEGRRTAEVEDGTAERLGYGIPESREVYLVHYMLHPESSSCTRYIPSEALRENYYKPLSIVAKIVRRSGEFYTLRI
ncbi:hypothetical protein Tco_1258834 [Tanacetum coccineum]